MKVVFKLLLALMPLLPVQHGVAQTKVNNSQSKGEVKVYFAQDESAREALRNMLSMFGRKLVAGNLGNSPVSGRFEARNVDEVMAYFESAFQVNWFQNGITVYLYSSNDWRTRRIYVGGDRSTDDWKDLLTSAGLYYKEFTFAFKVESKELIASGPRDYLALLESSFKQERPDPSEQEKHGIQLMVFPLRHASVEDRLTTLRGTEVITPGALTVLLNLLGLPAQAISAAPQQRKAGKLLTTAPMTGMASSIANMRGEYNLTQFSGKGDSATSSKEAAEEKALSVTSDPRTNAILIRDAKSKYDYYKVLIDQLDKPVAMIEVEAMMVEVDQTGLNELGLEFGLLSNRLIYDFPGEGVGVPSLIPPGTASIVNPTQFLARLKALSADENAKVLARPTIVTQDNVAAYIDLSETVYLRVSGERVADVVPITAGSLLQVTPRVVLENEEEKIFIRIEIQDGTVNESPTGIVGPRTQNTSLSTQALINREKAILVGGYNRESTEFNDYKVPFFGSLPVIGKAFSSTEKRTQTVARLFLITPRLVDGNADESQSTRNALDKLQSNFEVRDNRLSITPSLRIDGLPQR